MCYSLHHISKVLVLQQKFIGIPINKKQKFESILGQTHLLILENLLERQEATGAQPGDIETSDSHYWELILPQRHWW